jgi:hypothetical protein
MRVLLWFYVQLMNETRGGNGENTKYGTVKTISKQRGGVRRGMFCYFLILLFWRATAGAKEGGHRTRFLSRGGGGEVAYKGKGVSVVSD